MNITEKIERSKSSEKIDFTKISCSDVSEPLVLIENSEKILVEPIWTVPGDYEGTLYAAYIKEHPDYDGVYIRSTVLDRLKAAADALPEQYKLVVRAGHRPIGIQQKLLNDLVDDYKSGNPDATDQQALEHARMYVSDPAIKLPPHCCGAALDVELFDAPAGAMVDFGSIINLDSDVSHLHSDKISPEQRKNRLILLTAMLDAGFSSYYAEWWHYSYGDEIWAWFYSKDSCLYGLAEV